MSKKLYVIPVVVALLALMAVPATASEASTTVELTIDPYCNVTISGPISVTVSGGSGAIPLTEADVTVECNRSDHVISVTWNKGNLPAGVTYLENVSGTYSAGKKTGAVGIDGSFAIGDAAGTYSGGVTVDCSPAS